MVRSSNANQIARWNGSAWSPLQAGALNSVVNALVISGGDLYVVGVFSVVRGSGANYITKWNGSGWSALGSGLNGLVNALAVSGSNVYVGDNFTRAGGNIATNVAMWNGSAWSGLGFGVDDVVYALAPSESDLLYVGGYFTTAGGKLAAHVAMAYIRVVPVFTSIVPNPSGTQARLTFTSDPVASFYLLSLTNLTTWQTNSTVNATGVTNSVSVNLAQPKEFFRLRRLP